MNSKSIDLAIKYHSLGDEDWEQNGAAVVVIASNEFRFKEKHFELKEQLFDYIRNQSMKDILILYDNDTEQNLIIETMQACKDSNVEKLQIKGTEAYCG